MCGILGTVNIDFDKEALDLMKHRGPDDWGIERLKIGKNIITDDYYAGKEKDYRKGVLLIHFGMFLETFEELLKQWRN